MKKISKIFVVAAVVAVGSGFAFAKEANVNKSISISLGSNGITVNLDDDYLKKRPIPVPQKDDSEIRKVPEKKNGKPIVKDSKKPVSKKKELTPPKVKNDDKKHHPGKTESKPGTKKDSGKKSDKKDDKSHFDKPPRPENPAKNGKAPNRHEFSGRPEPDRPEENDPWWPENPDDRPGDPWTERPITWKLR